MRTILTLLFLLAPLAAEERAWRPGAGRNEIAAVPDLLLQDEKRGESLHVRVTYPKGDGTYPVLVFSHGMFGSKDGYAPLVTFWAAHGYVCLQPSHPDSVSLGTRSREEAVRAWNVRPRQVSFLLDSLGTIEKRVPALKGKLDHKRVAVGGHSFGAHTSQLIGGVKTFTFLAREGRSFLDDRVKCVLLLSPQGKGGLLREESWKTLKKPALVLTGSRDGSPLDPSVKPASRLDPYKLSPPGDKYMVWIEEAHHGFGGISGVNWPGAGPRNAEHVKLVQYAGLAMLEAYVRGNEAAKAWLKAGELKKTVEKTVVRCESR